MERPPEIVINLDAVPDKGKHVFNGVTWADVQAGKVVMQRNGVTLNQTQWIPQTLGEQVWIDFDNGESYSFMVYGHTKDEYFGRVPVTTLVVFRRDNK